MTQAPALFEGETARKSIELVLPFPPYTNNLYRTLMVKNVPIRVPTGDAKKYKTAVARICKNQGVTPFHGDVAAYVKVYRPRRIGDLDGTFKAVFDGLKTFAYDDDKQIAQIHAERLEDKFNPRVEIEIREIPKDDLFQDQ